MSAMLMKKMILLYGDFSPLLFVLRMIIAAIFNDAKNEIDADVHLVIRRAFIVFVGIGDMSAIRFSSVFGGYLSLYVIWYLSCRIQ